MKISLDKPCNTNIEYKITMLFGSSPAKAWFTLVQRIWQNLSCPKTLTNNVCNYSRMKCHNSLTKQFHKELLPKSLSYCTELFKFAIKIFVANVL